MEQTKTFAGLDAAAHASVRRLVNSAKSKREELDEARANKEPLAECQEDFEMEVKRLVKKVDALATSTPPKAVTPCADMFARDHDFRRQRRLALAAIEKLETDTHDSLAEASLQNSVEAMVKMIRDQCEVGPKVVDADDALAVWRPTPAMYGREYLYGIVSLVVMPLTDCTQRRDTRQRCHRKRCYKVTWLDHIGA